MEKAMFTKYYWGKCIEGESKPLAAKYKAWVFDRSSAGIAGSNPGGDIDDSLLKVLRAVN